LKQNKSFEKELKSGAEDYAIGPQETNRITKRTWIWIFGKSHRGRDGEWDLEI